MNPKEIIQLIKSGESEILELKQSFNKEAVQSISAFANTKGGTLLIGINSSNEIACCRSFLFNRRNRKIWKRSATR
jgi:ATP-dependent DNA helicase RecG